MMIEGNPSNSDDTPESDAALDASSEKSPAQVYIKDERGEFIPLTLEPAEDSQGGIEETILVAASQKYHSGPLPSVETFRAYGEVVPDAPERILRMAEKEQEATHEFSRTALNHEKSLVSQGQWMGFISMMTALAGGIFAATQGHIVFACALVSPAVLTPIMRFYFKGKHKEETPGPPDLSQDN